MTQPATNKSSRPRRVLPLLLVTLVTIAVLCLAGWALFPQAFADLAASRIFHPSPSNPGGATFQVLGTPIPFSSVSPSAVSPLLFGTNLSLNDSSDQFLSSALTRSALHSIHLNIIRMPVRATLANATEIQAAQAIKSLGAYPVVVLRGAFDPSILADDTRIINDMNGVFGSSLVFYEFGNEEDLLGIDVATYTASWNAIVPQLKRLARNGHFIGPVDYHYDHAYLSAFLQHADPRPDDISWHEYACSASFSDDDCLAHIDRWTNHINDARSVMHTVLGQVLPIMITEWNYAADAYSNDGKINDSAFMSAWTTRAMQTLAAAHIFASMQYACTNSVYALVNSDDSISAQGLVMQSLYQQLIGPNATPG